MPFSKAFLTFLDNLPLTICIPNPLQKHCIFDVCKFTFIFRAQVTCLTWWTKHDQEDQDATHNHQIDEAPQKLESPRQSGGCEWRHLISLCSTTMYWCKRWISGDHQCSDYPFIAKCISSFRFSTCDLCMFFASYGNFCSCSSQIIMLSNTGQKFIQWQSRNDTAIFPRKAKPPNHASRPSSTAWEK